MHGLSLKEQKEDSVYSWCPGGNATWSFRSRLKRDSTTRGFLPGLCRIDKLRCDPCVFPKWREHMTFHCQALLLSNHISVCVRKIVVAQNCPNIHPLPPILRPPFHILGLQLSNQGELIYFAFISANASAESSRKKLPSRQKTISGKYETDRNESCDKK